MNTRICAFQKSLTLFILHEKLILIVPNYMDAVDLHIN